MGYANSLPYQQLRLHTTVYPSYTITSVAGFSFGVGNFSIPDFDAPISLAYSHLAVNSFYDDSGSTNYIKNGSNGSFGVYNSALTNYYTGGSIEPFTFNVLANGRCDGLYLYPGTTDLHTRIEPGTDQLFACYGLQSLGDSLYWKGIYGILDLYFIE